MVKLVNVSSFQLKDYEGSVDVILQAIRRTISALFASIAVLTRLNDI